MPVTFVWHSNTNCLVMVRMQSFAVNATAQTLLSSDQQDTDKIALEVCNWADRQFGQVGRLASNGTCAKLSQQTSGQDSPATPSHARVSCNTHIHGFVRAFDRFDRARVSGQ